MINGEDEYTHNNKGDPYGYKDCIQLLEKANRLLHKGHRTRE